MDFWLHILIAAFGLFFISGFRIINQYERGVKFTLGKYSGILEPGLTWVVPFVQWVVNVDTRQNALELRPQDVMTKDQVNLRIDGVVFYSVEQPEQSILNVANVSSQLHEKATSELKEIVGHMTLTEALGGRDKIATALKFQMTKAIEDSESEKTKRKPWGIVVRGIQINNIELPQTLVRAMAKEAEAEREKKAIVIRAIGEEEAAKKYSEAAAQYEKAPKALRLRELKTYEEIGKENNTMMIVIPSEMALGDGKWLLPFANEAQKGKKAQK
jgi:regulator of protease activity HflC (stomatin/prohibitin superfamily)